jgi:aspartyl-tRNA(Asn)/glutamyl-tRNA(Gln) amidotransferase subunit A
MAEFAGGGQKTSLLEHTRNPWKLDRTTSGSSSGSAGATAAGMVVFAIGSETGGSIVSPSASCGVCGMRPTYGRVSRYGCMTLAWSLDKIGPLARSAVDVGTVLEAIAGHDPNDPTSGTSVFKFRPDPGRVRGRKIGVHRSEFQLRSAHNAAVFTKALDVLKQAGFELEDFQLPERPYGECYNMHTYSEARTYFKDLYDDKRIAGMYNNMRRDDWMATSLLPASDYVHASRVRQFIRMEADELLAKYTAVLAPTSGNGAGRISDQTLATVRTGPPRVNSMAQLVGVPGISVPCGFDEDGMPLGLHITAKAWDEQSALDVAMAFQKETDWHTRRPTFRS